MNKLIPLTIAVTLLVGCASLPEGQTTDKAAVTKSALKGGGIGCAVGAVTGLVLGKKDDALKGCAAGAVVGGVSAAVAERNRQIEEANALAAAAQAAGMVATVDIVDQPIPNEKPSPAFEGMTIGLPDDVTSPQVRDVVIKAARLSDASKTPITLTVVGSKAQRAQVVSILQGALKPNTTATVKQSAGQPGALLLSPVPDVGA